ncbi:uncharacterized protein EV422DRAFT_280207 [Fimicolochytrium jonesii]|uniref:uncharacterized protein n=1 Tax=Fimicolochytrium jonesii TaxID=1396493 RepID=UPI0022FEC677|nr:uncharacterized protein EV422DRAFT_280207 [Fimicolochytrium jonesii]KAI8816602.1 hypothetical protein EV422DRAFT_280207 [Fimicolochytrium jonesii]
MRVKTERPSRPFGLLWELPATGGGLGTAAGQHPPRPIPICRPPQSSPVQTTSSFSQVAHRQQNTPQHKQTQQHSPTRPRSSHIPLRNTSPIAIPIMSLLPRLTRASPRGSYPCSRTFSTTPHTSSPPSSPPTPTLNRITLHARLGADATLHPPPTPTSTHHRITFPLGLRQSRRDKHTGEWQTDLKWCNVAVIARVGRNGAQWGELRKGCVDCLCFNGKGGGCVRPIGGPDAFWVGGCVFFYRAYALVEGKISYYITNDGVMKTEIKCWGDDVRVTRRAEETTWRPRVEEGGEGTGG